MEQIPIFEVLRRRLWMIIVVCMVAMVAGYGFSFLIPERYTASALVLVRPQQSIKINTTKVDKEIIDFPMGPSTSVETPSKTYIEIIKSTELIEKVVRDLGLDRRKETKPGFMHKFMPTFVKTVMYDIKQLAKDLMTLLKYGRLIQDDEFTKAVKEVQDNLTLKSREDTYIFEITYKGENPQTAADVVNTTTKFFSELMEEIRLSEINFIRSHLQTQLDQSRKQLDDARDSVRKFKETHSVFTQDTEYTSRLKVIEDLEAELAKAEALLVSSQSTLSGVKVAARVESLRRSLLERQAELAPLPEIERDLKEQEASLGRALIAFQTLDREVREADFKYSSPMPEIQLVSRAVPPQLPSSPHRGYLALASLVTGLVVGLGLAFFLEYLNRQVRSIPDLEDFVGVKVLATIPRVSHRRWRHADLL
jgi:uncharacterized protein involved in exopolysaccharide biosynthesis